MTATVLRNLRIWDGEAWLQADTLRLEGGRIAAVGASSAIDGARRSDRLRDCAGLTAIPGLIDAHVHMELDPERGSPPAFDDPRDPPAMAGRATAMVQAGITTARDLGGGSFAELDLRDRIKAGAVPGPRLLCAGRPLTSVAGHCHFWGGEVADADAARQHIDAQAARGVDLIKVMATGGVFTRGSHPASAQFDLPTLTAIIRTAADYGLPVAAHCHGVQGIDYAARAGVRTIEHCSWMGDAGWAGNYDPAVAQTLADQGVWVSPTVNRGWQRYLDNPDRSKLDNIRGAFKAMARLGIPFVASTDAGIPGVYHHHLPQALAVYRQIIEASAQSVLASATSLAARALGLAGSTGRLRVGLAADVVLLDGDPLADLAALQRLAAVWAAGREIDLR